MRQQPMTLPPQQTVCERNSQPPAKPPWPAPCQLAAAAYAAQLCLPTAPAASSCSTSLLWRGSTWLRPWRCPAWPSPPAWCPTRLPLASSAALQSHIRRCTRACAPRTSRHRVGAGPSGSGWQCRGQLRSGNGTLPVHLACAAEAHVPPMLSYASLPPLPMPAGSASAAAIAAASVGWRDVQHWLWPLFTERWGPWRHHRLGLPGVPYDGCPCNAQLPPPPPLLYCECFHQSCGPLHVPTCEIKLYSMGGCGYATQDLQLGTHIHTAIKPCGNPSLSCVSHGCHPCTPLQWSARQLCRARAGGHPQPICAALHPACAALVASSSGCLRMCRRYWRRRQQQRRQRLRHS